MSLKFFCGDVKMEKNKKKKMLKVFGFEFESVMKYDGIYLNLDYGLTEYGKKVTIWKRDDFTGNTFTRLTGEYNIRGVENQIRRGMFLYKTEDDKKPVEFPGIDLYEICDLYEFC